MKIVLDLRCAHAGLTGIGRYAVNLCLSLEGARGKIDLLAITGPQGKEYLAPILSCPIFLVPTQGPGLDNLFLPDFLCQRRTDVYHSPLFVLPSVRVAKYIATIHDVIPLARPDLATPDFQQFFHNHVTGALKTASHLVTVSEHARQDCVRHLSLDPRRITAIHEPVSPMFGRRNPTSVAAAAMALGLTPGFVLAVGAFDRRKNLARLVEAYARVRKHRIEAPLLVFAGAPSGDGFDLEQAVSSAGVDKDVRILGRVSDEVLACLYSAASVLVFPSLYEGFGLPVVEAMASGTPVIASRSSSIPEVAGDAAFLVDPESVPEIASAMERVLDDAALRCDLRERGFTRAARFSLDRQAAGLLELYGRLMREAA
jgi:alpha-1,3-rhamnosyl/mannosyltransferase